MLVRGWSWQYSRSDFLFHNKPVTSLWWGLFSSPLRTWPTLRAECLGYWARAHCLTHIEPILWHQLLRKTKQNKKKPTLLLESAPGRRKEARWFQHQISLDNGSFTFTRVPVFRFGSVTGPLVPWGWGRQLRSHKCYSCVVSGAHTYHLGVV